MAPHGETPPITEVSVSRTRLTDLIIQRLPLPEKGQRIVFDDRNFGIRLSQGGSRTWVAVLPNRSVRSIGKYPDMSLKTARREAATYLATANPNPTTITAEAAISAFLGQNTNRPRTVKDYRRLLYRHFPTGKLAQVTRQRLVACLSALSDTPAEQFHARTAFSVFLNWCVRAGYLEANPLPTLTGVGSIQKRSRILTHEELKTIWNALGEDTFSNIVRIIILTGCRRGEVQHITLDGEIAVIPAAHTKNKREHRFPVPTITLPLLRGDRTFNGWGKSKARLDAQSAITGYTLHDLRRTYVSLHSEIGTPIHIAEKLVNHVSGSFAGVRGIYDRYSYMDEMKEAVDNYETFIQKVVS